jgi:DNA mismatch repair protein MutS
MSKETPMMKQYLEIKNENKEHFLFYRMGDFYELFFEDAVKASKILNITLTKRSKTSEIPMAGIPFHAADTYIAKIINEGYTVAICEQTEEAKKGSLVKREVTRIITPSTASEDNYVNSEDSLHLCALSYTKNKFGLATLNMSNGEFIVYNPETLEEATEILRKIDASEVLLSQSLNGIFSENYFKSIHYLYDDFFNLSKSKKYLTKKNVISKELKNNDCFKESLKAAGAICNYIQYTQKAELSYLKEIKTNLELNQLKLDSSTLKNLELIKNSNGEVYKTLFTTLNETDSAMGARLLKEWISNPPLDKKEIKNRLDNVESIINECLEEDLSEFLSEIYDIERILTRVSLKTAKPRDLSNLRNFLRLTPKIIDFLKENDLFKNEINQLEDFSSLKYLLEESIVEHPPVLLRNGEVIKEGFNKELDKLKDSLDSSNDAIFDIEEREKERLGLSKLKISYNKAIGLYISISKNKNIKVPKNYILKQELKAEMRYTLPELNKIEEKKITANSKAITFEKIIFDEILDKINKTINSLNVYASFFAKIDVINSFAKVSKIMKYVKPSFGDETEVINGRHPVIEKYSEDKFIPNDFNLKDNKLILLTGTNMGGKSTYMRQNAIIFIMAYMGCFVPADKACIKYIDRIFTRIGSGDNLSEGESTFMVEMREMSTILNNCTKDSFVLVDEVGRGTSTYDGLSLADSFANELANVCDTIFSTHYFELTNLENTHENVINMYMDSMKFRDNIIFLHKIEEGSVDQSHGIEIAKMAGIPKNIINNANYKLNQLKKNDNINGKLGIEENLEIINKIKDVNLDLLSENEALKLLKNIQNNLNERS